MTKIEKNTFVNLGLKSAIIETLNDLSYKEPSLIQTKCIPYLISGRDVLGVAQTGSGKTAAFSLPLLNNIKPNLHAPQVLVLAPTRELAIQVAEAMKVFSRRINGINVVAIYGGQHYNIQLHALRQGPQVVVGTPGRLLDHLKRCTLDLTYLSSLVLDEADEMLRMGFIEDVENILTQVPENHQTALFSATMPKAIRNITHRFMKKPQEIYIQPNNITCPDISQSYWIVYGIRKSEALMRFLEVEDFDAAVIFVRTKNLTLEIAESLERNGYRSAALNGDMNQIMREKTLERLKDGHLDILIATDIAARGLDIERISFVVNYDIPLDYESYIHRIGRTGRAGRSGRALMFVENRERHLLRNIERNMKITIAETKLPNFQTISERRLERFIAKVQEQLKTSNLDQYRALLAKIQPLSENEKLDVETLAAVLLKMAQGKRALIVPPDIPNASKQRSRHIFDHSRRLHKFHSQRSTFEMQLYRIEAGRDDGVKVHHILSAITKEGNIKSRYIGNIQLFASYSTIELSKTLNTLKQLNIRINILNKSIKLQPLNSAYPRVNYYNNIHAARYS